MIDLNKEAEEYARSFDKSLYGYDGESLSPEDEKQMQDFVAGTNSKFVKWQIIQAQIDILNIIQQPNGEIMLGYKINNKIDQLQQELKQLQDEK